MSARDLPPRGADAVALDLHDYSMTLTRLLPSLLFRHNRESLVRWCKVRSWVDNALAGNEAPDVGVIYLAVAYLSQATSPDEPECSPPTGGPPIT